LAAVRPLKEIRVFSPNRKHRENFASKVSSKLGIEVTPVENPQQAAKDADIVALATNSDTPVFKGDWVEPGMHITSVTIREFDDRAWEKSDVIIFSGPPGGYSAHNLENLKISIPTNEEQRQSEVQRYTVFQKKIFFLSDLLVEKSPRRSDQRQITMMHKGWGLGIEFAAVGKLIYDKAQKAGLGHEIPSEWFTQTSHP
jgi:alanine dehydrogenase